MTNCYITLDYELCLGKRTGSADGCLVKPMKALTEMLDKYGIKVNVMVDAAYLYRMNQLKNTDARIADEYKMVSNNIRHLAVQGHAIQLHFHPQWIHTDYVNGQWKMDMEHYKLSDLKPNEMLQILSDSLDLLNQISGQTASAFRAGGFSIENFADVAELMVSKGIKVDTSVLRYSKTKTQFQTYDYSRVPNKTVYSFSSHVCKEDYEGEFKEYPISVKPYNSICYVLVKRRLRTTKSEEFSKDRWNDGIGAGYPGGRLTALKIKVKKLFSNNVLYASFDDDLSLLLPEIFDYSIKHYEGNDFVIISHPKTFTPSSLHNLETFIIKYGNSLNFRLFGS